MHLAPRGVTFGPKRVNDEVSSTMTCKFDFSTIENHYKDMHNDIFDKHLKSPQKGCFLALKVLGDVNQISPRLNGTCFIKKHVSPHFDQVSKKFNRRNKSYESKKDIFGDFLTF